MFRVGDLSQGQIFIIGNEVLVLSGSAWGIVGMTVPGWMDRRLGNWLMEGVGVWVVGQAALVQLDL